MTYEGGIKYGVSGRMKAIMRDFVSEARRSGYLTAEIRYEDGLWNDEHDKVYGVFEYKDLFKDIVAEEV